MVSASRPGSERRAQQKCHSSAFAVSVSSVTCFAREGPQVLVRTAAAANASAPRIQDAAGEELLDRRNNDRPPVASQANGRWPTVSKDKEQTTGVRSVPRDLPSVVLPPLWLSAIGHPLIADSL
jgi:hypothetical protein